MNFPKSFPVELKRGNTVVKIYRVQNGDYAEFRVVYYNTTGERQQRSFADYQRARAEADSVNASFATGNADTLTLSGVDKALYQRASKSLESLGIPLDAAATEYAEAKSLLGKVPLKEAIIFYIKQHRSLDQKQVGDVVDELVARKEETGKGPYARALRVRLGKFAEAFQCPLAAVTPADVERYLDALTGSGRSRFNCASLIKALFRYAQSKNYYSREINPLERVDMNFKDDGEIEIFTPEHAGGHCELVRS